MNRFFQRRLLQRVQITQLSVSHEHYSSVGLSSFEACAVVTPRVTASDRRPSLPGGARPAIQWSTRARRGARVGPTAPRPRTSAGAGARGAARAAHPPARVPVRRQGKRGRDVVGGAAVEAVRPHKQDHLPRRRGEAHVQRARCVTGPARDAQPPIAPRLPSPLPVRDDRFNKHTQEVCKKQQKKSNICDRNDTEQNVFRRARATQWVTNDGFFFRVGHQCSPPRRRLIHKRNQNKTSVPLSPL